MLRLCLHCLKLWKLWLTDILPQNFDWILTYSATRSLCNPLVVILPSLVLIFTIILLMETWRVIKDNGPINTVISANKIFTGRHWTLAGDIWYNSSTAEETNITPFLPFSPECPRHTIPHHPLPACQIATNYRNLEYHLQCSLTLCFPTRTFLLPLSLFLTTRGWLQ